MATYFLFGKYNAQSVQAIDPNRTANAVGIIEKHDGQITAMYGLLGEHDLVFIVNLPGNPEALKVSIELASLTGISFTSAPAITVDRFDQLITGEAFPPDLEDLDFGDDEEL